MNLYKVYLRDAGHLNIIFVSADSLIKVPQAVYRRCEHGAIIKVVHMFTYQAASIAPEYSRTL